jgi:excisionase family DNA binding protein
MGWADGGTPGADYHLGDAAVNASEAPLMTVQEVAEFLRVSVTFVYDHSNGNRQPFLPSVKMGKSVRFRRAAVMAFIKEQERAA